MSTTLSMWLGISFVALGITAVLLQAWLWNPKYWDEVNKRSRAPRGGLALHRWVGIAFTLIYIAMMWEMIPRLWEYQVELPARTVIHALAAIILGVLLTTKLVILRWFRHFEESMPQLGFGILLCTVVIGVLSVPFALRAQGFGVDAFSPENIQRVENLLAKVGFDDDVDRTELTTDTGLSRGARVLVDECVRCHDMRTILAKPRPAASWYKVVSRMTSKPSVFGEPIAHDDVPFVTAYLVAITPEIQESRQLAAEQERKRQQIVASIVSKVTGGQPEPAPPTDEEPSDGPSPDPEKAEAAAEAPAKAELDTSRGPELLEAHCTECHELDEVTDFGGADAEGWATVVRNMVEEGMEIDGETAEVIVQYLAQKYPKSEA